MTIRTAISNLFYSIGDWVFTWGEMLDDRADEDHLGIAWDPGEVRCNESGVHYHPLHPNHAAQAAVEGRPADIHFTEHELGRLEDDGGPARPADEPSIVGGYRLL